MIQAVETVVGAGERSISEAMDRLESGIGPHRILIDAHGTAESPKQIESRERYVWQSRCHCVLIRDDGWSLGCPRYLYDAARELWPREWIAVVCYANTPHRVVIKLTR